MSVTDIKSAGISDKVKKFHYIIVIIKRFADSHKHDAVDSPSAVTLSCDYLSEYFIRPEISDKAAER